MTCTIVQATSDDVDVIHRWSLLIHQHEHSGVLKPHPEFSVRLHRWLSEEISNKNTLCLLAYYQDHPVGFILGSVELMSSGFTELNIKGIIKLLWVEPDYRKKKIARQLVDTLERCFKECGVSYLECHYTYKNDEARQFWNKVGFIPQTVGSGKLL
jgi:GNAT superfamily N-acetyltransferase